MDFQNLMITPALDRDIGSTYMYYSMPMAPMSPMYPMAPISPMSPNGSIYGTPQLRPISNDKFERVEQQRAETKKSGLKAGAILASIVAAALLIGSRGKIKAKLGNTNLFKNLAQKPFVQKAKAFVVKSYNAIKNFFAGIVNKFKKTPALPPGPTP